VFAGNTVEEVEGHVYNSKTCQINLSNIQEEQFGTWTCRIGHTSSPMFQEAHMTVTPSGKSSSVRLPQHLHPLKYNIFLTPFIEVGNFTIQGHEDILINVVEGDSRNITLHSEKIKIFENTVKVIGSNPDEALKIEGIGYDEEKTWFIIYLEEPLLAGENITLSMDFLGDLNDDLTGFYRSDYINEQNNETVYLASTQFETDGARRAMPCFDEPAFKAIFQVNLGRLKNMTSIGNMPVMAEGVGMKDNDVYVWDMYENSPMMSTYLLAFVVSDLVYIEGETRSNGVEFKVWSRKSLIDQAKLAAEIGPLILEYYERHYDLPYPLPKMDLVAVPDFSAGAMENWGLITFRETALLFKKGGSSISDKEKIVSNIAHELAHQWFGNLVTMEWWTE
jgi:aminopeptidase N